MAPAPDVPRLGTEVELPLTHKIVMACFITLGWYNVVELTVIMQSFFKRHSGLYFYSLVVANAGVFFHGLGHLLKFYHLNEWMKGHDLCNTILSWGGWTMMVTGQSLVLYSRLHLIVQATWTRWVLGLIILDGLALHISTGVLTFLTNLEGAEKWAPAYSVVERIQVSMFFVQEIILSGIYIWKTASMLRAEGPIFNVKKSARGAKGRNVLIHTIVISAVIIGLDITLIALEFSGMNDIQTTYKTAVYSIKLKMEFAILNALMKLVKGKLRVDYSPYTGRSDDPTAVGHVREIGYGVGSRRQAGGSALGHSSRAYARMDDDVVALKDLKSTEVMKTTTTEVRVDHLHLGDVEERSQSKTSSEVEIIDKRK
ncbi:hypothetical protein M011DRAFT_433156 [Sporormia fimetaria CBS 119925]|uniref:DUF7703 domain-containing protein n=1 Tax=Sporormia fimetaria CBS 119925 TaxID=1340428 RepID=A0A6A6UVV7_9PLEO|nr:hypothetical protein M011DRAFT_433156 [Sporormia fimetaria CBS 119925]